MTLAAGTHVGPYEVTARIGAGGMGEVYRARDIKLHRDVALKTLPDAFARDEERLLRFKREAQVLASLNHPNIAAIYGFEDAGGVHALVLELVEGPTLAERIAEGAIPVEEALPIARQIAEALETAHEHGVVHRDLKPANVKLTADGIVKVLDFGLAKALTPDVGSTAPDVTASPTITSPAMTALGVILGTAAYMAPEQAKGRPADKRADVWAFGCVLYEMLTGRGPFAGDDVSDTLANVLKREPDWNALPADVPPAIRALLKRCLEKDRRKRVADVAAALFAIDEAATLSSAAPLTDAQPPPSMFRRIAAPFAALVIGAGLVAVPSYFRAAPPSPPEMRLQVVTPSYGGSAGIVSFDVSPDGQSLAFLAATEEGSQLWLRTLGSETARPLAGTENSLRPFWSPDGRSIGFSSDRKLKRVDVGGGSVQILGELATIFGASWGASGVIVFAPANTAPLYRVPATGGQEPVEATRLMPGQLSHRFPHFLPDGRRFLFYATGAPDVQGVYLGTLDSLEATRLLEADTAAVFVPPAWVLFGRGEALYAQRIDFEGRVAIGDPVLVVDRVARNPATFATVALSASVSGVFAYRAGMENAARELAIVNRQGREESTLGAISGLGGAISISPDGRTVAANRTINRNTDVWLIETARGVLRRFTFHAANESAPVWSPDGNWIAFHSARKGGGLNDLYRKPVGGGEEAIFLESSENKNVGDWSPDGRFFVYVSQSSKTGRDIWAMPSQGDQKPQVVVQTEFAENSPRFSPDGRWITYESNETGRVEVFVQPFPGPGRNWQISTAGGTAPQWRGDGREIFYLGPDNRLMAASFEVNSNGSAVDVGTSVPLFSVRPGASYAATGDGQRFLINSPTNEAEALPITVVLNWNPPTQ